MAAMVQAPAKPVRRFWQFTLPVIFLALAMLGAWIAWSVHQVRERDAMLVEIELAAGSVVYPGENMRLPSTQEGPPILWRLCGAKPVSWLLLPQEAFTEADRSRIRKLFPEARVGSISPAPSRSD